MSNPQSAQGTPVHVYQHNQSSPAPGGKSAIGSGIVALLLCVAAFVTAPLLLLIPYIGFVPALLAAAGVVVAALGLRGSTHGTGTAVTGLIVSVAVFALLAGIATLWNVVVADPAIRDYDELHEVIDYIKGLVFGS
ncbi:MAG: hypothetical protein L0J74_01615 [Corynebacterium sp.]|uniref:hypothetical protein n=1 Tax=Corynebacterium TaxID=1716 RepID=UPI00264A49C4|nr:hypothetical protein [Corynebacterium sp.]MDN6304494.1 hypothetical protein [Corynebacterium sp.]MDN6366307.1 hypothetical protein [Corynebacterium sp.]MDN6395087.1 hypothetical protein [Corynebacterium sp.]